jgi:predicted RNA binding protein YcfA (HicA-like mRNA interferase family)
VLKEFFRTDYRGIMTILEDSSDLQTILELEEIPHYTTLQKAARRLTGKKPLDRLMDEIITIAIETKTMRPSVQLSAIDSTGFESHHVSSYFVRRRAKGETALQKTSYTRFPKAGIVMDCKSYMALAVLPSWGPSPDILHWKDGIRETLKRIGINILLADAGYDSEESHRFAREDHGIRTIIPNRIGRPTKKLPSGKYRKIMATRFNKTLYGQRWQIETLNSVVKRRLGSFLRARSYWAQMREMRLRLFAHNVMVVRLWMFSTEHI